MMRNTGNGPAGVPTPVYDVMDLLKLMASGHQGPMGKPVTARSAGSPRIPLSPAKGGLWLESRCEWYSRLS